MAWNRVLRYFNTAVALLLVAVSGVLYWFAWRPLPQTSGRLTAPVRGPAEILRDPLGRPHILASSIEDAVFLQGFVTAQDRMWQMDALRRLATGMLAEVFGPAALESDLQTRRLRLARLAREQYAMLSPSDRAVLVAYARGVNHYLETHRKRLPVEFTLLRYEPRPWRPVDSLAIGLHMFRALTSVGELELQKLRLLESGDRAKVEALYPLRLAWEVSPGSNAWALSGSRTASGKPLLAGDPHLEYSLPSIWHPIRLKAPGLNVAGVALTGVPGVIIGHNEHIAWSMTNLQFDVQDLYAEQLDPQTGRYLFAGRSESARLETETVPVRGAAPVTLRFWVTRHGPVVIQEGDRHYALRWTAAETRDFGFPILDLNRARNWQEFRAALRRYASPAQNFVYADRDGHIGYQVAGRLPIRRRHRGDVPADGPSGNQEWEGFIPFDELPSIFDPPSGLIVSANQNPFPPNYPYPVHGYFAAPYRAAQIRALLESRSDWRAQELPTIQKDVYSAFHHFLARQAVAAWRRSTPRDDSLAEAVAVLERWNGQMEKDQAAPLVAVLLERHWRKALVERAAPGHSLGYRYEAAPAVMEMLLRARPSDWFPDFDARLLEALREALEEGRRMQGPRVDRWSWGRSQELLLAHPVLGRLPLVGPLFRIGPVPLSGATTTVKQTTSRIGPSMRMVVDLADPEQSLLTLPTGVSGHGLSRHFRDQWATYYRGDALTWPFERVHADSRLRVLPEPNASAAP